MKRVLIAVVLLCLFGFAGTSWADSSASVSQSAYQTIFGQVALYDHDDTMGGYILPATVSIDGGAKLNAVLDTGSARSVFPDSYLRGLGYSPSLSSLMVNMAFGTCQAYLYRINCPTIWQDGIPYRLSDHDYIYVVGAVICNETLIGCDILSQDNFALHNGTWTLTIPN